MVLAKLMLAGLTLAIGMTAAPDKETVGELAGSLSSIPSVAVCVPVVAGVKVTVTWQLSPGATVAQRFVAVKSLALAPVTVTLVTVRSAAPVLVTVTAWLALVVPSAVAKMRLVGLTLAIGTGTNP